MIRRGAGLGIAAALVLGGCGTGERPAQLAASAPAPEKLVPPNPSALIKAELAFARLAREAGQWAAYRETAATNAVMFVPQPVTAQDWLKGRADPAQAARWSPHRVWMSCDGSLGVTTGAWRAGKAAGYFVTAWQRQDDGTYRWTTNQSGALAAPLREPKMLVAEIASCEPLPPATAEVAPVVGDWRGGTSRDATLYWTVRVDGQCGRIVTVRLNRGEGAGFEEVLNRRVDPPRPATSCAP